MSFYRVAEPPARSRALLCLALILLSGTPPALWAQNGHSPSSTGPHRAGEPPSLQTISQNVPPPGVKGRPTIGLALGGGGALAMSEIGVLQWFEEHHIPVDMVAGTSMGCMVGALYSTGKTIPELKTTMNDRVFNSVFRLSPVYANQNYRRREDSRELPNAITIGLKHGVSLRNGILLDQGLNAFLDRQFLVYGDRTNFNDLPIPLRCIATDLNDAKAVTFANGSLPDAVRASISLPGIYPPYEIDGHEFVDGGVLENLPTETLRQMHADVILAVSLPLSPVSSSDLNSIFGVLLRSFSVAIEANEERERKLADVLIQPDVSGFSQSDYLKTASLAQRGYQAAEEHKAELLKYAVSDAAWKQYLAHRAGLLPGAAGTIERVQVKAPSRQVAQAVEKSFQSIVDKPVNGARIDALLDQVRSDGRYDADYTIGYERGAAAQATRTAQRPVVVVTVTDKKTGPPFLELGANVEAQTGGVTRATIEGILVNQDLGGYGSELRAHIKVGFLTDLQGEYYRHLASLGQTMGGLFIAPQINLHREPFYIYQSQRRISERQLQFAGGGLDLGWSDQRRQEVRLGWQGGQERWRTKTGSDALAPANLIGSMQRGRLRYVYDSQNRALVPQRGIRVETEASFFYHTIDTPNTPRLTAEIGYAHQRSDNLFILRAAGGTMFHRNVAQPFRFTLGGPMHLSASAIDEYRGTDYFLLNPSYLRRIAMLPAPLGQSIYLGIGYEAGQMRAPDAETITRQDVYFGLVAETPLGIITLAPAIGDGGHRKFVFTLGKLF